MKKISFHKKAKNVKNIFNLDLQCVLTGIICFIMGIAMLIYTKGGLESICLMLALVCAVCGIGYFILYFTKDLSEVFNKHELSYGLAYMVGAIIFLSKKTEMMEIVPIIIGLLIIFNSIDRLQSAVDMKRADMKMSKVTEIWLVILMFAIAGIILGLIILYNSSMEVRTMIIWSGISFVFVGITNIITQIYYNKKVDSFKNSKSEVKSEKEKIQSEEISSYEPIEVNNEETVLMDSQE